MWEEDTLLTKSNKIILIVVLAAIATIFLIGAEKANGQEFTYTPSFDWSLSECTEFFEGNVWRATCLIRGNNTSGYTGNQTQGGSGEPIDTNPPEVDGCRLGFDRDGITGDCVKITILEEQAIKECEEDRTCPLGDYGPDYEPPFIAPELFSQTDRIAIKKINEYIGSRCFQGIGTTLGIQNPRSFEIPTIEVPFVDINGNVIRTVMVLDTTGFTNESLDGLLGIIERHVRECVAQNLLLNPQGGVLSEAHANKGFCDSIGNQRTDLLSWCGKTYSHVTNAKNVPVWSQQRVNEEANRNIDTPVFSILENICKGYYERSYKTIFPECVEYFKEVGTGGTYAKQQEMKVYDDSAYQTFKDGDESEQLEKVMREKLAEDIQGLLALQRALQK